MLTIVDPLIIEGHAVYNDEANDLMATPRRITGFWIMPQMARLGVDDKGNPAILLIKYRGPRAAGAEFSFQLELTPPDETLKKVAAALSQQLGQDAPLTPVSFTNGRLKLMVMNSVVDGQQVLAADFPVAGGRCAVVAQLTTDGAALLEQGARQRPLLLIVTLDFELRLQGAALRVIGDGAGASSALRTLAFSDVPPIAVGCAPDPDQLTRLAGELVARGAVKMQVAPTSPSCGGDALAACRAIGENEVARRLGAFLAATPLPADDAPAFNSALGAALTFDLADGATAHQQLHMQGMFAAGLDPASWIKEVELNDDAFSKAPTDSRKK
jgi:hypothetical protein